jgi:hypothetical protein
MDRAQPGGLSLSELQHLYERLTADQRDDLLQCLFTVAPRGGEAMIEVLEHTLLCHAVDELLENDRGGESSAAT